MSEITCPACRKVSQLPTNAAESVVWCPGCSARIAYGEWVPPCTVLVDEADKRFRIFRFDVVNEVGEPESVSVRVDGTYAAAIARSILGVDQYGK